MQVYEKVSSGLPPAKPDRALAGPNMLELWTRQHENDEKMKRERKKAESPDDGDGQAPEGSEKEDFERGLWNAIGETIRMAEKKSDIVLGSPRYGRWGELL